MHKSTHIFNSQFKQRYASIKSIQLKARLPGTHRKTCFRRPHQKFSERNSGNLSQKKADFLDTIPGKKLKNETKNNGYLE